MIPGSPDAAPSQEAPSSLALPGRLLARNALLNFGALGFPLLVALCTIPVLVRRLGQDRFGVLGVEWLIINCAGMFDLGLWRAVRKFVAESLGRGDRLRVATITYATVLAQLCSGTVGAALIIGVTPLVTGRVLHIPPELRDEARRTFYLIACAIPMVVISESLGGVFEAAQRFDLVTAIKVPFNLAIAMVPLAGALLGWGLVGITLLLLVGVAAILAVECALCARLFPELRRAPPGIAGELRTLLGFGRWVMVTNVVSPILVYADRLAIGVFLTMAAVTHYTAPFEMVTHLSLIPTSVAATLFPAFATLGGQGRHALLQTFANRAVKYLLLILGPMVIATIAYSPRILSLWLGPGFADSALPLQLLTVGVLTNALAQVPYALIQARGRPDLTAKLHLVELPIQLVLVWLLVRRYGIPGAALAWTFRVTLDATLLFAGSARLSSLTLRAFLAGRVIQGGALLGGFGLLAVALTTLPLPPWMRLLAPPVIVASAVTLWSYVLDGDDRAQVLALLGGRPAVAGDEERVG